MTNYYHVSPTGRKPCTASEEACKYGERYTDPAAADQAYEKMMTAASTPFKAEVSAMAGGRYYGCSIRKDRVDLYLGKLREAVGDDVADNMMSQKAKRDRGDHYHMTVVTPQESKDVAAEDIPRGASIQFLGLGTAKQGNKEAWFIVARCDRMSKWRADRGLPPQDFHVTLGFLNGDVHGVPKGESTIVS